MCEVHKRLLTASSGKLLCLACHETVLSYFLEGSLDLGQAIPDPVCNHVIMHLIHCNGMLNAACNQVLTVTGISLVDAGSHCYGIKDSSILLVLVRLVAMP